MRIGSYQILFELARGGMGTVFLARAIGAGGFERLVAVKRANARGAEHQRSGERFLTEARVAAYVHHANVVSTHVAGSDDAGDYLVCDYVEGASLAELFECAETLGQRLPTALVLRVGIDALAGLHAAHETTDPKGVPLDIIHRDISPQNLLVGRDGVTRITDFGVAKSRMSSFVTDQRYLVGKLTYLAPEYLLRLPVGRPLDIYAMGVTLWTALAGRRPWRGADDTHQIEEILTNGVPPLAEVRGDLCPPISTVIARACDQDPGQRYQTARDMLIALEEAGRLGRLLASSSEVAEYVETMVGENLAERREAVRAFCAREQPAGREQSPRSPFELVDAPPNPLEWQRLWPKRLVLLGAAAMVFAILYALTDRRDEVPIARAPIQAPAQPRLLPLVLPNDEAAAAPLTVALAPEIDDERAPRTAARAVRTGVPSRVSKRRRPPPVVESTHEISVVNPYRQEPITPARRPRSE